MVPCDSPLPEPPRLSLSCCRCELPDWDPCLRKVITRRNRNNVVLCRQDQTYRKSPELLRHIKLSHLQQKFTRSHLSLSPWFTPWMLIVSHVTSDINESRRMTAGHAGCGLPFLEALQLRVRLNCDSCHHGGSRLWRRSIPGLSHRPRRLMIRSTRLSNNADVRLMGCVSYVRERNSPPISVARQVLLVKCLCLVE